VLTTALKHLQRRKTSRKKEINHQKIEVHMINCLGIIIHICRPRWIITCLITMLKNTYQIKQSCTIAFSKVPQLVARWLVAFIGWLQIISMCLKLLRTLSNFLVPLLPKILFYIYIWDSQAFPGVHLCFKIYAWL
jgi:hypothetical protein